jgi:hypothetical protein
MQQYRPSSISHGQFEQGRDQFFVRENTGAAVATSNDQHATDQRRGPAFGNWQSNKVADYGTPFVSA